MPIHDLKDQIARLPEQPGVYLYANAAGETIYVGKARVAARPRPELPRRLAARARRPTRCSTRSTGLEVIVTDSVVEALALENNLIKQRSPKYNILLRDDKNYPYLQLTTGEAFPRVLVARARRARRQRLRRPVPARQPGAPDDGADAPAVRHPLVQRGDHRRARPARASSTTSSAASRRASRRICSPERVRRGRRATRGCSSRAGTTSCVDGLRGAHGRGRGRRSGSRRRRSCATRCARCRRCASGSRRWRRVELGDRDVFGVKVGPAGAVVQVFQVRARPRRRARRAAPAEAAANGSPAAAARRREVLQAALPAVLRGPRGARRRCTCRSSCPTSRGARELAVGAGRPARARRRAEARREARPARPGRAERRARLPVAVQRRATRRTTTALETLRAALAPARRCRGGSSASTSRPSRAARPWRRWSSARTAG